RIQRLGGAGRKGQIVNGVRVWHTDVLYRGVFLDPFGTTFAAHTGMLDATKWCSGIWNDAGIEADEAKFDLVSNTQCSVRSTPVRACCLALLGGAGRAK